MLPAGHRPPTSSVHYTTSCNTQSGAPEDGQNNFPKHVVLTGIINKPLLMHLVCCICYLYQWGTVKQISANEIYFLIKYIKSVLWRVAKGLSYIEDARCLKVKVYFPSRRPLARANLLFPWFLLAYKPTTYTAFPIKFILIPGSFMTYRSKCLSERVLLSTRVLPILKLEEK
jgi:hypothetical protein